MDVNVLKYKYKIHFKPHYIHDQSFEDVILLSRDGKKFNLNVCIFASLSKLCRELAEGVSKGSIRIQTELSYLELYKIVTFAKTGCLHGYQSRDELDPRTLANFKDFGVDLFHLRFIERFVEHKKNNDLWTTRAIKGGQLEEELLDIDVKPFDVITNHIKEREDIKDFLLVKEEIEIEENRDDDHIEDSFIPGDDSYCDDNEIIEEKPLVRTVAKRKCKKRKSSDEDGEWLPDSEEDKPLRKKRKKKATVKKTKNENESEKATPNSDARLFHFPQDESLRYRKKPFQCHLCVKGFQQRWFLRQHIMRHGAKTENDRFFCLYCLGKYMAFPNMGEYEDHIKAEHKGRGLQCPHCEDFSVADTRHIREMYRHIREVHGGNGVPIKKPNKVICVSCGSALSRTSSSTTGLSGHLKRYGPFHDAKCRICPDFEAKTWEENKNHYDTHHSGEVQIKCGFCPGYFRYKMEREDHLKEGCPGINSSSTAHNSGQTNSSEIGWFERGENRQRERVVCPHCAKDLSRSHLQTHINAYHGTHHIPCTEPGCDYIIRHPDAVKIHIKQMHNNVQCEECGWFGNKNKYKRHYNQKHTSNDKRPFKCKECGKGFTTAENFKDHQNIHLGLKPHKCPICLQGFGSIGTMHGHLRGVHKGIKRK